MNIQEMRESLNKIETREYLKSIKKDYTSKGMSFFEDFLGDSLEIDPDIDETYNNILSFIKNSETTEEELKYVLSCIRHNKNLLSKYIAKNKLDIGIFSDWDFVESLPLKPKEIYDKPNITFIKELEKRLNMKFFIKGKVSAELLFNEAKKISSDGLNKGLVIGFKDGSKIQIDSKGKTKNIKPKK